MFAEIKASLDMAGTAAGLKPSWKRDRGVRDCFLEADPNWTPQQLAAHALFYLTNGDGSTADEAVCLGVLDFLDGFAYGIGDEAERLKKCLHLVTSLRSLENCRRFVEDWFPE